MHEELSTVPAMRELINDCTGEAVIWVLKGSPLGARSRGSRPILPLTTCDVPSSWVRG